MKYVCVIGGANIDLTAMSFSALRSKDSNPGILTMSLGGVGRNIAENLARLGINVVFITALADDSYGKAIIDNCQRLGIDLSHCLYLENSNTSTYTSINDADGDMYVAVSDMGILQQLDQHYLITKLDIINNAICVVTEANISHCMPYLQANTTVPIFFDAVSTNKAVCVQGNLSNIFCVKANRAEAEVIANMSIDDQSDFDSAMDIIHSQGTQWVMITEGSKGVRYSDGVRRAGMTPFDATVRNANGAGDSFLAGVVASYCQGNTIDQCCRYGCAVASITVADDATVSDHVSTATVDYILSNKEQTL